MITHALARKTHAAQHNTNNTTQHTRHAQTIPLYVVTNTKVGIIGSREVALRLIQ